MLTEFQSDLDKLRNQIDECKCLKSKSLCKFFLNEIYLSMISGLTSE